MQSVMGAKNYSMRIWLDPTKLAAYGLNPTDVTAAISEQSKVKLLLVLSDKTVEVRLNILLNM